MTQRGKSTSSAGASRAKTSAPPTRRAGGRQGLSGPKSGLWREFQRVLGALRPQWACVENVARGATWVPVVRRALWELGYSSMPIQLCSDSVGAPHRRSRIFILAHADRQSEPLRAVHAKMASVRPLPKSDWIWRTPPPGGFRLDDGVPRGMDRCRCLGNAVMPQMAEYVWSLVA